MKIRLTADQTDLIDKAKLKALAGPDSFMYRNTHTFNLQTMKPSAVAAVRDVDAWLTPGNAAGNLKARSVEAFAALLAKYLSGAAAHWVFRQRGEHWEPYYVVGVKFREGGGRNEHPPQTTLELAYRELGAVTQTAIIFGIETIRGRTIAQALGAVGCVAATDDRIAEHEATVARWDEVRATIGAQYFATGYGTDDVDGNDAEDDDRSWRRWRSDRHQLLRETGPSKVVLDVFYESEKARDRDNEEGQIQLGFWATFDAGGANLSEDEDGDDTANTGEVVNERIPVHPMLVVFDLARHLRMRVHVDQLTPYRYDDEIGSSLVIDADRKALVKLLIETKCGGYADIVKGKGGGAVVLLSGPPGTGKTLTAEVYAEAERRVLYSVQCSQLGTDPDTLEAELARVFRRGNRWKAVMLLDEADVYVHERGNDLQQNAIVGVFLRLLEYQDTILFLTTNRPDDVDDAIASRCIARLSYSAPSASEQARIWRVLADLNKVDLSDDAIGDLVADNPGLSGRDVKNLLKLARMIPGGVSRDTIRFVRQFQPTVRKSAPKVSG